MKKKWNDMIIEPRFQGYANTENVFYCLIR